MRFLRTVVVALVMIAAGAAAANALPPWSEPGGLQLEGTVTTERLSLGPEF